MTNLRCDIVAGSFIPETLLWAERPYAVPFCYELNAHTQNIYFNLFARDAADLRRCCRHISALLNAFLLLYYILMVWIMIFVLPASLSS